MIHSTVARSLLLECEDASENSLLRAGYGGWLLYTAASAGDLSFVHELLKRDPLMVFGEGEFGVTDILYAAARSRNAQVFRLLLDFALSPRFLMGIPNGAVGGVRVRESGSRGDTTVFRSEILNRAVHAAARGGSLEILMELLRGCSDVLVYRDATGSTVLHAAAGRGQAECPKQPNNTDCGYYVLKYMKDIFDARNRNIPECYYSKYIGRCFNQEEIDEVRNEWATCVLQHT